MSPTATRITASGIRYSAGLPAVAQLRRSRRPRYSSPVTPDGATVSGVTGTTVVSGAATATAAVSGVAAATGAISGVATATASLSQPVDAPAARLAA